MTLIQCFCPSLLDNLAGCLRLQPQKLVLLGDPAQMQAPARQYRAIANAHGIPMTVELRAIQDKNIIGLARLLADILCREQDCIIDLTGCDELVALAVGAVMVGLEDNRHISVQRYDWKQDLDIDCDGDGHVVSGQSASLTVQELIALHGGTVHPSSYQPSRRCTPEDMEDLWTIVAEDPKQWNQRIAWLREFESRSFSDTDILLPLEKLRNSIDNFEEKKAAVLDLLHQLRRHSVIWDSSSRDLLNYRYSSVLLQHCTAKAGNALELKALLEARSLRDPQGSFFSSDCMSVNIDWDGIIHTPEAAIAETRNEIDLVLIRGLTPLFISCKNGNIGDEELYKLHTVATRFGGPYARKMLIATNLDKKSPGATRAFIQRATDMGIRLVTDAAQLSRSEWESVFRSAIL